MQIKKLDRMSMAGRSPNGEESNPFYKGSVSVRYLKESPGSRVPISVEKVDGESQVVYLDNVEWAEEVAQEDNVLALNVTLLLATFIKDANAKNITHLAVGTGPAAYDYASPPASVANERLAGELIRKPIRFTNFVDGSGDPTLDTTSTVDLTAVFDTTEAVGTLEEMGLFGGEGAENANGGYITNYKTFIPFAKPSNRVMVVTWRIRFTL